MDIDKSNMIHDENKPSFFAGCDENGWFPNDYSPELSVKDWMELLQDVSVFTPNALQIMKRIKDCSGQATCKQLSLKYGESSNFYNRGSSALARRVAERT